MTETTVQPSKTSDHAAGPAGAVALALLDIVDAVLVAGPERSHVLSAALELAVLQPDPADLDEARAEVEADHAATTRALTAVPTQRAATDIRTPLLDAADTLRDRRLEVLDLALGLVAPTS